MAGSGSVARSSVVPPAEAPQAPRNQMLIDAFLAGVSAILSAPSADVLDKVTNLCLTCKSTINISLVLADLSGETVTTIITVFADCRDNIEQSMLALIAMMDEIHEIREVSDPQAQRRATAEQRKANLFGSTIVAVNWFLSTFVPNFEELNLDFVNDADNSVKTRNAEIFRAELVRMLLEFNGTPYAGALDQVSLYPSNDERFEEMATILRLAQARSEADADDAERVRMYHSEDQAELVEAIRREIGDEGVADMMNRLLALAAEAAAERNP